jgi:restriction system protein
MSIPDYQVLMLPLLQLASDGKDHTVREAKEVAAARFELTEDDKRDLLPSGRQATFDNRVGWAGTYLRKAGLLESSKRGVFRLTERGRVLLAGKPETLGLADLLQYEEFQEFRKAGRTGASPVQAELEAVAATPEEQLEAGYQQLRADLAGDLLQRILASPPDLLERLVVDLLVAMGYGGSRRDAGMAVGQSGDGGIDGVIKEDSLGLDAVYIQAKRWSATVGRPVVQAFAGSLEGFRARKGVLITTSDFSRDARDYVGRIEKRIVLIDGAQLAQLMIDHGIGVTEVAAYSIKRVDGDYFGDDGI